MSLLQLRKELKELKNSLISETQYKIFIINIGGLTTQDGLTIEQVDEYERTHPYTKVLRLQLADFRVKDLL